MRCNDSATVEGSFLAPGRAREAARLLKQLGFRDDQVAVLTPDGEEGPAADRATNSKVVEGVALGAAVGAGVGGLWALGMAAGGLPGLGPAVPGGVLVSVLASVGGGAAAAGLFGALLGLGIPRHEAAYYRLRARPGRTLVRVQADGRYDVAWALLRRLEAHDTAEAAWP